MNLRTLSIVSGISAVLLGGACSMKLNLNQNYDDTKCAGYVGCSAGQSFGITTVATSDAGAASGVVVNSGCGQALPDNTVPTVPGLPTGYTHFTVQGTGLTLAGTFTTKAGPRTFWVRVPKDYDPNTHYRLVYVGQGCGSFASANIDTWHLYSELEGGDEEAIYVAIDLPTDMVNQNCYDNESGPESQEWQVFQLLHYFVDSHYCVDEDRIYVSGYSTGGWLANMWGCYFAGDGEHPWNGVVPAATTTSMSMSRADSIATDASMPEGGATTDGAMSGGGAGAGGQAAGSDASADTAPYVPTPGARMFAPQFHIRGQAAVSGEEPSNQPPCNGPVAGMWIHDAGDNANPISANQAALARVLKMNGCVGSKTAPWHADYKSPTDGTLLFANVCVQYTDCPAAYPVVFCTTNGEGHASQDNRAIPGFKFFFDQIESATAP